jgi:hypothetical protein
VESFAFPGTYEGQVGRDDITWEVRSIKPYSTQPPEFELRTTIRAVELVGRSFDLLDPVDKDAAARAGLDVTAFGLANCVLAGSLPCELEDTGHIVGGTVEFRLDLRPPSLANVAAPMNLQLVVNLGGDSHVVVDDWFEDGLLRLQTALPQTVRLHCCITCQFSDYSPGGHGLIGMRCHRDAKEQYLAVHSKSDYFKVPVTEEVLETYICPEYQARVAGTGYRG